MDKLNFFKKKPQVTAKTINPESHGSPKTDGGKMMEQIRNYLQTDFPDSADGSKDPSAFCKTLDKEIKKHVDNSKRGSVPADAASLFYVSADCMRAYACILPPAQGGKDLDPERFLEDMRYEGIAYGIDQRAVAQLTSAKTYLRIVQIAKGQPPEDGVDGKLEELYERRHAQTPELSDEEMKSGQDFRKKNLIQTIREGEPLCRITPPVPATFGCNVAGTRLLGKAGNAVQVPQGRFTSISEDGLFLRADISGIVLVENDAFTIHSQRVLEQDIDATVGNLKFDGDIYIRGNVEDGVTIEATGNIMIIGDVRYGEIKSGGTICVQGEVKGDFSIRLRAAKQIQCLVMENVTAYAIEDIYTGVIANSEVVSEKGSVYALMGRGLIFNSAITAGRSVYARKIGNISSCLNHITLGLEAEFERRKQAINDELDEINRGLELLRKTISNMQIMGQSHRTDSQKDYNDLVEQRNTYGTLKRDKLEELEILNKNLRSMRPGSIICESIYPVTNINIEKYSLTIEQKENDCNIHLLAGQIVLK